MPRRFNILGPCQPALHYMLPVTRRLARVQRLIDRGSCFVVHAPENLGKTTTFANLARELTAEGRYAAVLLSMAVAATAHEDIGAAELAILGAWREDAASHLPPELRPPPWQDAPTGARIGDALTTWARACPRPLALFFDDFDALTGPPLISLLCQLRDGFPRRPEAFPWSLALVGLHDVSSVCCP